MVQPNTSIAVIGAGVAGLAAALAGRKAGCQVKVYEKTPAASGDGAVMLLWPNAVKAAAALGVRGGIESLGTKVTQTKFRLWNDSALWELDVAKFEEKFSAPALLISRPALVGVLEAELRTTGVVPVPNADCSGFDSDGQHVLPRFEKSVAAAYPVDGLIGADGRGSAVRKQLRPGDELRPAYHTAWIGLSTALPKDWDYEVGETVTFLGDGLRMCVSTMKEQPAGSPNGHRLVYWYATEAISDWRKKRYLPVQALVQLFETVHPKAADLIRNAESYGTLPPTPYPIYDRAPVRRWSYGPVTLCGDAAHPSTPDLGQGACQALESAVILGQSLKLCDDVPSAFERYERKRLDRTARVTELSRLTALQSMTRGPLVETIRELGIRTFLPTITAREFDALFSIEFS